MAEKGGVFTESHEKHEKFKGWKGLETLYLLTFQGFGLRIVGKMAMLYTSTIVAS